MNKLKKIFLTAVATLTVATVSAAGEEPAAESYRNNRHPLLQKDYIQLPLGTIRAEGWMHDQLTRMRDGMTGHLDKVYTKVMGPRNGWLGGDGDVTGVIGRSQHVAVQLAVVCRQLKVGVHG